MPHSSLSSKFSYYVLQDTFWRVKVSLTALRRRCVPLHLILPALHSQLGNIAAIEQVERILVHTLAALLKSSFLPFTRYVHSSRCVQGRGRMVSVGVRVNGKGAEGRGMAGRGPRIPPFPLSWWDVLHACATVTWLLDFREASRTMLGSASCVQ